MNNDMGFRRVIALAACVAMTALTDRSIAATILYVDDDAPPGGDGLTWATAFDDLQAALETVRSGDQIRVAEGTYKPDGGSGDTSISFVLRGGVALYGGFAGLESTLEERAGLFRETVLSGDLNEDDGPDFSNRVDNSDRMLHIADLDAPVRIDGFLVRGGSGGDAAGAFVHNSKCVFVNCIFLSNIGYGGGAINNWESDIVVVHCGFFGNRSASGSFSGGGAISNYRGTLVVVNSIFSGNRRQGLPGVVTAGAIVNWQGLLRLSQCTFVHNYNANDSSPGGVLYLSSMDEGNPLFIDNCIFRGNFNSSGISQLSQIGIGLSSTALIRHCAIEGWNGTLPGFGNTGDDPAYANPAGADGQIGTPDDDFRLGHDSPCVDAGLTALLPHDDADVDLDGDVSEFLPIDYYAENRVIDGDEDGAADVDMGAAESRGTCLDSTPPILDHARLCEAGGPTIVHSGYIDPRRESNNGIDINEGMREFTLIFSEPVFDVRSAALGNPNLTAASFEVVQTGEGAPPIVTAVAVDLVDPTLVRVTLDRIITLRQWTTLIARVEDKCGNRIPNRGDLGPGAEEPDRADVGFLPGDINQSGSVNPLDLLRFKRLVNGLEIPKCLGALMYVDTDRNGTINPLDLLAFKRGINGTIPCIPPCGWDGTAMAHDQP